MKRALFMVSVLLLIFVLPAKTQAQTPEPESDLTQSSFPPLPVEPQRSR